MKKSVQEASDLDGYDDLRPEDQATVIKAWQDGHVADEDIPDSARKPADEDGEEKPKKTKKAAVKKKANESDGEAAEKPKKAKATAKVRTLTFKWSRSFDIYLQKAVKESEDEAAQEEEEEEKPKKKRAPTKKKAEPKEKAAPKKRASKKKKEVSSLFCLPPVQHQLLLSRSLMRNLEKISPKSSRRCLPALQTTTRKKLRRRNPKRRLPPGNRPLRRKKKPKLNPNRNLRLKRRRVLFFPSSFASSLQT